MGKNSGGVTDWHKHQHKKQLTKNKEARIAARDERVVQEKTVQEIRAEIRKIEQHHKNEQQRPHAIQSKLDRLKKELKLVTAKEDEDKRQHELTLQQQKDAQKFETKHSFIPLARPEVSIYYHPLMNPFGAPPPGQPRLYHRRGGGTTASLDEACSLQEQFLPPPPPPPPPRPVQPIERQRPPQKNDSDQSSYRPNKPSKSIHMPESGSGSVTRSIVTETTLIDPTHLPNLPAPSAAVARSKRNKLTSDIWASNEEIQYEQIVSSISLEGVASTVTIHTQWYYKDMSDKIQGPFTTDQMLQWNQAGYFPITTLVSGSNSCGPWKTLKDIKQLKEHDSAKKQSTGLSPTTKVASSVQDRIAALRHDHTMHHNDDDESGDDVEDSIQMRIAALKAAPQQNFIVADSDATVPPIAAAECAHCTSGEIDNSDVQANSSVESVYEHKNELSACSDIELTVNENTGCSTRIASKSGEQDTFPPSVPPQPASENDVIAREELLFYPVDNEYVASYPIDDDAYNVDSADDAFPFEDSYLHETNLGNEADIPVTGDYDYDSLVNENTEYPATSFYDNQESHRESNDNEQPKKKIKVDESVIALVPSRIRKRY